MTQQEAKAILVMYRPDSPDAADPEFAEALALARQDAELGRWLAEHCAVQGALRARFRQIPVPQELQARILAGPQFHERIPRSDAHVESPSDNGLDTVGQRLRPVRPDGQVARPTTRFTGNVLWWRHPAALAAAAALVGLAGLAALWWRSPTTEPERLNLATFRNRMGGQVLRNYAMTLETDDLNRVRDHLAQRQSPADFVLPEPLGQTALAGCGVLRWRDKPVSMICFLTGRPLAPGEKSDLFLFVVDRGSLPDAPANGAPQFAQVGRLATASWSAGDRTYVLAVPGGEAELRKFL